MTTKMNRAQPNKTRGGDPDGARVPPKTKHEDKEAKLDDQLDDSFPASDPPSITQPTKREPPAPKKRKDVPSGEGRRGQRR